MLVISTLVFVSRGTGQAHQMGSYKHSPWEWLAIYIRAAPKCRQSFVQTIFCVVSCIVQ